MRILNTRPADQARPLTLAIEAAGGIVIEFPTLVIDPTPTTWLTTLTAQLNLTGVNSNLPSITQALFISSNAVRYFFTALRQANLTWPSSIIVTAIGSGTAQTLQSFGIKVDWVPTISDSEHVLALTHLHDINHQIILLVKGVGGRELIQNSLCERGAQLHIATVYRRILPNHTEMDLNSLWRNDAVDIILFTSHQAMQHLFTLLGKQASSWIRAKPCLVISPRLAKAASALGIQTVIVSAYADLLTTLEGFKHDNQ